MTTATQTLTEFVLQRIAEDEAAANNWLRFEVRDGIPGNYAIKERVLAECEAKRGVIHQIDFMVRDGDWTCEMIFRHMATPYKDHADYRPEWDPDYSDPEDFR